MGSDQTRRLLARLAGDQPEKTERVSTLPTATNYARTIEEASAALDDLDAAAAFVEDGGLDRLEAAVERAGRDLSECAHEGRETLAAYRAFRAAADGTGSTPGGHRER